MIYKYKAISQNGEIIQGFFEGKDKSDVLNMLRGNNYLPVNIEKDMDKDAKIDLFLKKVSKKDLAVFCRQFYTMLDAGIDIVKCVNILEKQSENKTLVKALASIHEDVQKGFTLSESMKRYNKIFPSLLINMVEAGEISGNLDIIMERMAVHFEKENKLESKINSAMIYPMVLGIVSIAVVIFLLVAVMPTFIGMFESGGQDLPIPTQILLKISNSLKKYWYIFIVIIAGIVRGITIFKRTYTGMRFFDGLKLKIPIVRDSNIKIVTSRFTRTLSTLISSGIPLIESIGVVGKVINNTVIQDKLYKSSEDIRKGKSLSSAINELGVFPPMVDSMIKIGEESGSLDEILYKTADFYDNEVEAELQRMTSLMEPVMLLIMAVIIGFIVISMALPMFDMVNNIY